MPAGSSRSLPLPPKPHEPSDPHPCARIAQVVASDGVWDVMGTHEVVNRVMDVITAGGSADEAATQLVHDAVGLAVGGPHAEADNTSAVVMVLA